MFSPDLWYLFLLVPRRWFTGPITWMPQCRWRWNHSGYNCEVTAMKAKGALMSTMRHPWYNGCHRVAVTDAIRPTWGSRMMYHTFPLGLPYDFAGTQNRVKRRDTSGPSQRHITTTVWWPWVTFRPTPLRFLIKVGQLKITSHAMPLRRAKKSRGHCKSRIYHHEATVRLWEIWGLTTPKTRRKLYMISALSTVYKSELLYSKWWSL